MFFPVLFTLLGLSFVVIGALQARIWRMSDGEPRLVRAAVSGKAASRLVAGLAFLMGGLWIWWLIVVGGVAIFVGDAGANVARRQLEHHT